MGKSRVLPAARRRHHATIAITAETFSYATDVFTVSPEGMAQRLDPLSAAANALHVNG